MTDKLKFDFRRHDSGRLVWTCVGPEGAYHIWAQIIPPESRSALTDFCYGGIEVHYPSKPYDFSPDEPPIKDCWLTGCDCWPDGGMAMAFALPIFIANGAKHGFLEWAEEWQAGMTRLNALLDDEADQ